MRSSGGLKPPESKSLVAGTEPTRSAARSKRPDWTPKGLCLVATPIGNAADISLRALRALEAASLVACEDTRVTGKLLALHGIQASLTAYHEHNAARVRPNLIRRLKNGESVTLVSDAGTPLVSDPGYQLVRACIEEDIPVTAVPGPSAVLTALQLSGLPSDRFYFAGFLPHKSGARKKALAEAAAVPGTLIFMESPKRLPSALADMAEVLGPREAAVTRELTKMFEEVRRGPLDELARDFAESGPPKGEITMVVGPATEAEAEVSDEDVAGRLRGELATGSSRRDAIDAVAAETGRPRREVYALALGLDGEDTG